MAVRTGNTFLIIACCLVSTLMGCTSMRHCRFELIQQIRTSRAWAEFDSTDGNCVFSQYASDYRCGWKAGYYNVLSGGDGRPPVIPPEKYWNPSLFRDCDSCGQREWCSGFRDGAVTARCHADSHLIRPCPSAWCGVRPSVAETCDTCDRAAPPVVIRLLGIEPVAAPDFEADPGLIAPAEHAVWEFPLPVDGTTELTPEALDSDATSGIRK